MLTYNYILEKLKNRKDQQLNRKSHLRNKRYMKYQMEMLERKTTTEINLKKKKASRNGSIVTLRWQRKWSVNLKMKQQKLFSMNTREKIVWKSNEQSLRCLSDYNKRSNMWSSQSQKRRKNDWKLLKLGKRYKPIDSKS